MRSLANPFRPLTDLRERRPYGNKEPHKPTEQGHVDCKNAFFLSCDRSVDVVRLRIPLADC
jgi:hypothetical protein